MAVKVIENHGRKVVIVGAGLSGLSAAYHLERSGYQPVIYEASDRIGGRVKTDSIDGYLCDHGFQVLLSSYTEVANLLPSVIRESCAFPSGAIVNVEGSWIKLENPLKHWREMTSLPKTFWVDYLRLAYFVLKQDKGRDDETTEGFLKRKGLSTAFIETFLRPFFAGVFLDCGLTVRSSRFCQLFPLFVRGRALLPRLGMQQLPKALLGKLKRTAIHLNTEIKKVDEQKITFSNHEAVAAENIILAIGLASLKRLYPGMQTKALRQVKNFYFSVEEERIKAFPHLYLDGRPQKALNNFSLNSLVQPSYAPRGYHLISASVVSEDWQKEESLQEKVKEELAEAFSIPKRLLRFIKEYTIANALPDQSTPPYFEGSYQTDYEGLFLCGESVSPPSLNDALISGREVVKTLIQSKQKAEI